MVVGKTCCGPPTMPGWTIIGPDERGCEEPRGDDLAAEAAAALEEGGRDWGLLSGENGGVVARFWSPVTSSVASCAWRALAISSFSFAISACVGSILSPSCFVASTTK